MRKFSEIEHRLNEEFLNILNKKNKDEEPQKFVKTSKELIENYSKNLISESFLKVEPREKEHYNFSFYKIKSMTKLAPRKFSVSIVTYDTLQKALGELVYLLEI